MAQRLQVLLVCDLDETETPGVETVSFAVDGSGYEIDVCARHGAALREAFAPYVAAGRRAGRGPAGPRGRRTRRPSGGVDPGEVRTWARAHNVAVSDRGRISADLLARYAAAKM